MSNTKKGLKSIIVIGLLTSTIFSMDAMAASKEWRTIGNPDGATASVTLENPTGLSVQATKTGDKLSTIVKEGAQLVGFALTNGGSTPWASASTAVLVQPKYRNDDSNTSGVFNMLSTNGDKLPVRAELGKVWRQESSIKNRIIFIPELQGQKTSEPVYFVSNAAQQVAPGSYSIGVTAQGLMD